MRNILARANLEILEQIACSQVLLAFDYDGTLAPIVDNPDRAFMRPSTRQLLRKLATVYPCIVISGRSHRDAFRLLRGVGMHQIVGNHGMEPWHANDELATLVAGWMPLLEARIGGLRGVFIENKVYSVAVHYRASREKRAARRAILDVAAKLGDLRMIGGKMVINLLPKGIPHKGAALLRERERLACDTALFVGDDETDEDVFSIHQPGRLLAIRVGRRRSSAAPFYIAGQKRIDDLLRTLLALRPRPGRPRSRRERGDHARKP